MAIFILIFLVLVCLSLNAYLRIEIKTNRELHDRIKWLEDDNLKLRCEIINLTQKN
jgi:hypothetical protein